MSLLTGLLPASFRGVPFAVADEALQTGRRVALHEYPGRDAPWAEDMGRGARRFRFRGFILADDRIYAGGPIATQRLALIAATEVAGAGLLTHPVLGLLKVVCEGASIAEALDGATYSSVEFSFVEAGQQGLPSLFATSLGVSADVLTAVAVATDAVRLVALSGHSAGGNASGSLPAATTQWSDRVVALGSDATALSRLTAALPGNLGRYSRGATSGFLSRIDSRSTDTLGQLIALAAAQRAAIAAAAANLARVTAELTVTSTEAQLVDAVADLVGALAAACADPADALRLLKDLLGFAPIGVAAAAAPGAAVTLVFLRLVALELVRAAAVYQPASYEDAFATLVLVTSALDHAITVAGDLGQDALFGALRALHVQVVADLRARGASLRHVRTFSLPGPLPAIAVAQRLYRDAARADELVGEAGDRCVSPLFMPATVQALAA